MSETKIQWTDATWNPVTGCTRASEGCDNCYAVTMTKRLAAMGQEKYQGLVGSGRHSRHFNGVVKTWEDELQKPLRWRKPRMVFVNSMSDLFHKDVPFEFIDKVFAVMALCPQHMFQVLTKRAERMADYLQSRTEDDEIISDVLYTWDGRLPIKVPSEWSVRWGRGGLHCGWPIPNVWLGVSTENQEQSDARIPHLLRCPAAVRFVSAEPLLGSIDFRTVPGEPRLDLGMCSGSFPKLDWIIIGGESGRNARPCDIDWIRSIVRQCREAGVAAFVKQLGTHVIGLHSNGINQTRLELKHPKGGDPSEFPEDLRVMEFPETTR